MPSPAAERLITPRFVVITLAGMAYFLSIGMMLPVLPTYVEDELGGGGLAVGLSVACCASSRSIADTRTSCVNSCSPRRILDAHLSGDYRSSS